MLTFILVTLAETCNVTIQEALFPFVQLCSVLLAIAYRYILHPKRASTTTRHVVATVLGLSIGFYCYAWSMFHVLLHATLGLVLMKFVNRKYMAIVVFIVIMTHLSIEHIRKMLTTDASFGLHHETPMMMMTMKITSLAYGLHDSYSGDISKQHPKQRRVVVRKFPTLLEYFSFTFNFHTFLVGPGLFFTDYIDYIEGKHIVPYTIKDKDGKEIIIHKEPPTLKSCLSKAAVCIVSIVIFGLLNKSYTPEHSITEEALSASFLYRTWLMVVIMNVITCKYMFAIGSADVVCIAAGFGFNGYDENGTPKWDLVNSVNFWKFWVATDINDNIGNWNVSVIRWLRYVCYYRIPFHKDKFTVLLSAVWHGFYPGHYWTLFLNMMLGTKACRKIRLYREQFTIKTQAGKVVYFCICYIFNTVLLNYLSFAHFLAYNEYIITYYSSVYFWCHILLVVALLILPPIKKTPREKIVNDIDQANKPTSDGNVTVQSLDKEKHD